MSEERLVSFDSVRNALTFAFNADASFISPPTMNKMMAAVKLEKKPKKGTPEEAFWKRRKDAGPNPSPALLLRGLDMAAQAGFILAQIRRLDEVHQRVLEARFTQISKPCDCRAPCCQGFRLSGRWKRAIEAICEHVQGEGSVLGIKGRLGLSTEPRLRAVIVERHFRAADWSIASMATGVGVSPLTAAKHIEWIERYLERVETEALAQISDIFDQTGITGLIQ